MEENLSVPGRGSKRSRTRSGGETSPGVSGGCLSQPSSPRLSSRLGKVSRLISRSDANIVHSSKVTVRETFLFQLSTCPKS